MTVVLVGTVVIAAALHVRRVLHLRPRRPVASVLAPGRTDRRTVPAPGRAVGVVLIVLIGVGLLSSAPLLAPAVPALVWGVPRLRAGRRAGAHERAVLRTLPEAVDLLLLAVSAGLTVPQALRLVGQHAAPPIGPACASAADRIASGVRTVDALGAVRAQGSWADRVADALAASVHTGAPVVPALTRLAGELREVRRRDGEQRARRIPVLQLFPLVLCILPAFGATTVVPLIVVALRAVRL